MIDNFENINIEEEAKKIVEKEEAQITSLGKAQSVLNKLKEKEETHKMAFEMGWKNLPLDNLPSYIKELGKSMYPEGTEIVIRAASVGEIRHFSSIDFENDQLGVIEGLNYIIEKCCRIKCPGKNLIWKDIYEIDRFYIIMAIRELTFINGENKLNFEVRDSEGVLHKLELKKEMINYFNFDKIIYERFNPHTCKFDFQLKNGDSFTLNFPTLGVMQWINNYVKNKLQRGENPNKSFIKYAPFIIEDWRKLNDKEFDKIASDSLLWSFQKLSVIDRIIEILSKSININVKYTLPNGEEGEAPINFQGGIKSIFIISDFAGELL